MEFVVPGWKPQTLIFSTGEEDRFVKRSLWVAIAIGLLLAPMSFGPARADTALDMATFTCQDWLDASDHDRALRRVWPRGCHGGRAGASLYDPDATRTDRTKMEIYCRAHLAIGVISA